MTREGEGEITKGLRGPAEGIYVREWTDGISCAILIQKKKKSTYILVFVRIITSERCEYSSGRYNVLYRTRACTND